MASKSVSELNVILLGSSLSLKNYVVNLLLMKPVLNTETEPLTIQTYEGKMNDQRLTVVMTPDLQRINRTEFTGYIKTLSGPRVFLLVLQPEDFTEKHKDKLQLLLESCSEKAFDQSLLLISMTQAEKPGIMKLMSRFLPLWSDDPRIQNMIIKCKYRYLCINDNEDDQKKRELKRKELLTRISQMLKENCEPSQEENAGLTLAVSEEKKSSENLAVSEEKKSCLNLVLCGRAGAEKSSVLESITGQSSERLSLDQCEKLQVEVCGRWVSVLELPPLSGSEKPVEEVMEQCLHCLSLCGPQGVQAFILVLPLGSLTDEDKSELKTLQDMFSSAVRPFMMVLFTVDSDQTGPALVDKDLQELCEGRHLIFNTRGQQQVSELLDFVETLRAKSKPHSFTTDTLIHSQRTMFSAQLREIPDLKDSRTVSVSELNVILLGNSFSPKNYVGNLLLMKPVLNTETEPLTIQTYEGKMNDQRLTVVMTPDLQRINRTEFTGYIKTLSGPCVFLLVLQPEDFTEKHKDKLQLLLESCSEKAFDQSLLLISMTQAEKPGIMKLMSPVPYVWSDDPRILNMIIKCKKRYLSINTKKNDQKTRELKRKELLTRISQMLKENCEPSQEEMEKETLIHGQRTVSGGRWTPGGLRIALVGITGSGKSSSGNTILGRREFKAKACGKSVTKLCLKAESEVDGRLVAVVDTPGLFDTSRSNKEIITETTKSICFLAPGPHVILLVLQIGRFTEEEQFAVEYIKRLFGENSEKYIMVLFTRGDDLEEDESIEDFIKDSEPALQKLITDCGNRVHVFKNKNKERSQVKELLQKIDHMVEENGGTFYTNKMIQEAEEAIQKEQERIMKEQEEEIRRKYQQEMERFLQMEKQRQEREKREMEEQMKKEQELWKREQREREEREREKEYKEKMEREIAEEMERGRVTREQKARKEAENRNSFLTSVVLPVVGGEVLAVTGIVALEASAGAALAALGGGALVASAGAVVVASGGLALVASGAVAVTFGAISYICNHCK